MPEDKAGTTAELHAAIDALTAPEAAKLEEFSKWRVRRLGRKAAGRSAGDLLNEAVTVTLAGNRKWNKANVDLTGHLMGAMRSISSHWARDFDPDNHPVLESELARMTDEGHKLTPFDLLPGTDPVADRALEEARDQVEEIRAAFADDPIVSLILDGMREGMSPPEVRSELGLTQTEYETAMRRLKRKAGKIFPAGGTNA